VESIQTVNIDKAFGIHAKALELSAQRAQILATNLANADTPNYKAKDIDFKSALTNASQQGISMKTTNSMHISSNSSPGTQVDTYYRNSQQPTLDGNTVDSQIEQAQFMENAIRYQTTLTFLSGSVKGLLSAIRGE